jgi:nucleotide-binding universal stress UspA family protein
MPSVPDAELVQATRRVARCFAEARESKAWCDDVLGQPLLAGRLRIQIGHFIAEAACRAAEVDAAIIVLVPSIGRIGDTAAALADASACPVLVVRTHQYLKPR